MVVRFQELSHKKYYKLVCYYCKTADTLGCCCLCSIGSNSIIKDTQLRKFSLVVSLIELSSFIV